MHNYRSPFENISLSEQTISVHEKARLMALETYPVFDTPEEEQLNDITKLAALICDTPVALINLVDKDKNWLKSRYGLRIPQTERCTSFCQYTIMEDTLFQVQDTLLDERFVHSPLVAHSPHIRFYCGAPLINPEGFRLGSLCVIDFKPKELTLQQRQALEILAKNAATCFELRRQKKYLEEEKIHVLNSEKRHRELVEHSQGFICKHDLNGHILSINPAACQALQYEPGEIIGKNIQTIVSLQAKKGFEKYLYKIRNQKTLSGTIHIITKNGEERYWTYSNLRFDEPGSEPYIISSALDITDRYITKKALQQSKKELEVKVQQRTVQLEQSNNELWRTNVELDTFLYRASHDLRGPLTSFLGMCNLALLEFNDPKVQKYFQMIATKAAQTNRAITKLIEVNSVKHADINYQYIDLREFIATTLQELEILKENNEILKVSIDTQNMKERISLYSDESLLKIMISHIIDNSVKYRKNDNPTASVHILISQYPGKNTIIEFQDNGVGIPWNLQDKVFDMFFRGNIRSEGSGLGLYLVKKAVEKLGGNIKLESKVNIGTTIIISLPDHL